SLDQPSVPDLAATVPDLAGAPQTESACGDGLRPFFYCGPHEFCIHYQGGVGADWWECDLSPECEKTPSCECLSRGAATSDCGDNRPGGCHCAAMVDFFSCGCP